MIEILKKLASAYKQARLVLYPDSSGCIEEKEWTGWEYVFWFDDLQELEKHLDNLVSTGEEKNE